MASTLRELALKYGSDKAGHHEFCEPYEQFIGHMRNEHFSMLELGIGGYQFPDRGGGSLRMWLEYFPNVKLFALDLHKKNLNLPRTQLFIGSQDDPDILNVMLDSVGEPPWLIIDDASHINPLTLATFQILFQRLAPGGVYVVEDVHTSYWADNYQGGDHPNTVMNYFKTQADNLNQEYFTNATGISAVPDIESITFYKEIIFIRKKA